MGRLHAMDPVTAARRELSDWFNDRLRGIQIPDGALARDECLAGMLALAEPTHHNAIRRYAAGLNACNIVPRQVPAGGDPVAQLASWDVRVEEPLPGRWRPSESVLPALLTLIADPSPAIRRNGPRTCGDQALAAIAMVLHFDPRWLVGRDPDAPWTDAERTATAEALRIWRDSNPDQPLDVRLTAQIDRLPPDALAVIFAATPADRRISF